MLLIENGYVTKVDTRNELGQIVDCTYTVYEEPQGVAEKPITENPISVNPSIQSTNINKVLNNTNIYTVTEETPTESTQGEIGQMAYNTVDLLCWKCRGLFDEKV